MEKRKKKFFILAALCCCGVGYVFLDNQKLRKKNAKLTGVNKNLVDLNKGLTREVIKISYQLGKLNRK